LPRPPKNESEKRQLIGARFDPADREKIVDYAASAGISPGAEVEKRVIATLAFDEEGLRLIAEIGAEIQAIQAGLGKRWHKDLKTWAAVMDMFRTGPMMQRNPDQPLDDDVVTAAYEAFKVLCDQRQKLIEAANEAGWQWTAEPKPKTKQPQSGGLFANALAVFALNPRKTERDYILTFPDSEGRDKVLEAHDSLLALDQQIDDAERAWIAALAPYWEKEEEGRKWNRRRQRDKAKARMAAGEDFNMMHLTAADPWDWKQISVEKDDAA
jgi:hypothetical protein